MHTLAFGMIPTLLKGVGLTVSSSGLKVKAAPDQQFVAIVRLLATLIHNAITQLVHLLIAKESIKLVTHIPLLQVLQQIKLFLTLQMHNLKILSASVMKSSDLCHSLWNDEKLHFFSLLLLT